MIINGLEFASERLQAYSPEPELPPSELEAIRIQTAELIQKLESSKTIPKRLKLIIFDLLNSVQRSIDQYRFKGIRGVRQELFVIASRLQEHFPDFAQAKDEPEVKGFFALLKKIDAITAAAFARQRTDLGRSALTACNPHGNSAPAAVNPDEHLFGIAQKV